jgi:phosphinothricin acetyltransferase
MSNNHESVSCAETRVPLVRKARAADCAAIAAIYNQAILTRRSTMDTDPFTAGGFLDLINGMTLREVLLVAEAEGRVCGWGIVKRYSDRPGYRVACETSVYVHEADRGLGHGAAIQQQLTRHAARFGYRHIVAKILCVNEESIAFHKRFGFEDVGVQRRIGLIDGVWHDIAILQHQIDANTGPDVAAPTGEQSNRH